MKEGDNLHDPCWYEREKFGNEIGRYGLLYLELMVTSLPSIVSKFRHNKTNIIGKGNVMLLVLCSSLFLFIFFCRKPTLPHTHLAPSLDFIILLCLRYN